MRVAESEPPREPKKPTTEQPSARGSRVATAPVPAARHGDARTPTTSWYLIGASVAYAAGLLAYAGHPSLWGDEGFTAVMVDARLSQILHDLTKIDVNMGAFYILVHGVVSVLGVGETQLRLVSVVAVSAALPVVWYLVRDLWNARVATLATVLLAANPFVIVLGLTARPYGLLLFMSAITGRAALAAARRGSVGAYCTWSLLGVLMLYVHLLALFLLAAQGLFILLTRRRIDRGALVALVIGGLGCLPTLLFIAPPDTLNWVEPFTFRNSAYTAVMASGGKGYGLISLLLALLGLAAVLRVANREKNIRPIQWLMVLWGAVPLVAMVALIPLQSLFIIYYFTPVIVPLAVFGGLALAYVTSRTATVGLLAAVVAVSVTTVAVKAHEDSLVSTQDWRGASALLSRETTPAEAVTYPNSFYRIVAEYYASGHTHTWEQARPILPDAAWGTMRPDQLDAIKRTGALSGAKAITQAAAGIQTIWLVGPPQDDQFLHVRSVLMKAGYQPTSSSHVPGILLLRLSRSH